MKVVVKGCSFASLMLLAACSGLAPEVPTLESLDTTTTLRIPIVATSDDAEEISGGSMQLGGGLLDLRAKDGIVQTVGLRFQKVAIPQSAKITAAHIQVASGANDTGVVTLEVRGVAADSAATFMTTKNDLGSRTKTAAASTWRPLEWLQGKPYQTGDLSPIVQEIVSRSGWQSGNALAFSIAGTGGTAERAAIAYGGKVEHRPVLVVTFDTGESVAPTPTPAPAPAPAPEPTPTPAPTPEPTDPQEPSPVGGDQAMWHQRLLATVENPRYPSASLDPEKLAATGDLYRLGRDLNTNLTALMLAYRETGDRALVEHLDNVMNIAKGKLADTNGDGYKSWLYLTKTDASSEPFLGTDLHKMDEMLTHSLVAAAAYTLKQAGYSSAAFWTDYLKNDFEAKWRQRSNKPSGYPFLSHFLVHPTTNFIRYHLYMSKLTGDSSYYTEAKRLAGQIRGTMRLSGQGYVWDHKVLQTSGCQPMVYVRYTTQALADIATADVSLFDSTFMEKVAYTMAHMALNNTDGTSLASTICGGGTYGSLYTFAQHPYAQLAAWDNSGRLEIAAERVYAATERYNMSSPTTSNVAAQMVFSLGR
ncbi:MAG: hypothetical protein AVDCRST_MAG86-546 [uncultured Truepera sp.]|uniref:Uncharacterized protein n=1 Tax=uncultured Truepera sp. TaxID=543023 RepID=A0A6J4UV89_9DEIN|nr:MAG: hypothetical protein AVDCRST_MAG86-546 [uncultured Truepera sp.]